MSSHHWFRWWLGVARQKAISWANVDHCSMSPCGVTRPQWSEWPFQYDILQEICGMCHVYNFGVIYHCQSTTETKEAWTWTCVILWIHIKYSISSWHHQWPLLELLPWHPIILIKPLQLIWSLIAVDFHLLYQIYTRADSRLAPSQWEMLLQSNNVSHWLDANLELALYMCCNNFCSMRRFHFINSITGHQANTPYIIKVMYQIFHPSTMNPMTYLITRYLITRLAN